jgi:hypothetical protein
MHGSVDTCSAGSFPSTLRTLGADSAARVETISVLRLRGDAYEEAGVYRRGDLPPSVVLAGFSIPVAAVFDAD